MSNVGKNDERELVDMLKVKLGVNCNIIEKNHRNFINYKFIFIRNHLNESKLVYNPYP